KNDIGVTRGIGDSMALRRACHDARLHNRLAPQSARARAIFDAVEQARVEAIGSLSMRGAAEHIDAMREDKYARANLGDVKDQAEAPLEEAVALVVRERLTGRAVPKSGLRTVSLWRDWIEEKAGGEIDALVPWLEDQGAFARAVRNMLASMDMGEELGEEEQAQDS